MHNTKRIFLPLILLLLVFASLTPRAGAQLLDIPPRLQWDENNGYCGEVSVQQIGLYYGMYASQYRIREILDPTQQQDLWVETSGPVLDALRLTYEKWDSDNEKTPQFRNYMVWVKQHIRDGYPVIMAVYVRGGSWGEEYDHIVPAIGATSDDYSTYYPWDTLTFNDNYSQDSITRYFYTLWDSRLMLWHGLFFDYCIPRRHDYGCAVTGIRDDSGTALPISVTLDRWDEPDIAAGAAPVTMIAGVTISSLEQNKKYAVLRYDDYNDVPATDFLTSSFTSKNDFTAGGDTYSFIDTFQSNTIVIYRCVPTGP